MLNSRVILSLLLAACTVLASAGCGNTAATPTDDAAADSAAGTDAATVGGTDAVIGPDVFDQDGALGFSKAPPLPLDTLPQSGSSSLACGCCPMVGC